MLALVLGREGSTEPGNLLQGVGESNIMAMCLIYLLAGAFATVAKATGGWMPQSRSASPSSRAGACCPGSSHLRLRGRHGPPWAP